MTIRNIRHYLTKNFFETAPLEINSEWDTGNEPPHIPPCVQSVQDQIVENQGRGEAILHHLVTFRVFNLNELD